MSEINNLVAMPIDRNSVEKPQCVNGAVAAEGEGARRNSAFFYPAFIELGAFRIVNFIFFLKQSFAINIYDKFKNQPSYFFLALGPYQTDSFINGLAFRWAHGSCMGKVLCFHNLEDNVYEAY